MTELAFWHITANIYYIIWGNDKAIAEYRISNSDEHNLKGSIVNLKKKLTELH